MNVKSFADLADVLINPDDGNDDEDSKKGGTVEEGEYGDDFEELDYIEDFEGNDNTVTERKEENVSRFSIEARGSEEEVLLNSRSYSRIEIRKSVESNDGAEEIIQRNLEDISVSGSDDDDDTMTEKDMPTPAKPNELETRSSRPDVIEISGNVPRRATAPVVTAAVRLSPGKSAVSMKESEASSEEKKVITQKVAQQAPGIKAPTKAFMSMNSKIQVASHWEVPGVSIYEGKKANNTASGSKVPNTEEETKYASKSEREKIVLAVLDLLQSASRKAQTQQEVEIAMRGHAIRIPSVRTGVSKRQALRAVGKMYTGNVPDYDPDFEMALDFMRSNEWNSEQGQGSQGSDEMKESSEDQPHYAPSGCRLGSGSGSGKRNVSNNKTFPESTAVTGGGNNPRAGLSARGASRKMNASAPAPIQSPQEEAFHPVYGNARGFVPDESPRTSHEQQQKQPPQHGPPNFEADKDLRAVNSSIENYATWLKPNYLKRANVLATVPADEAVELSNKCEKLYANFLNDLIQNCKTRADQCNSTEEMAMLRVLAEQVTSRFAAGEPQEDLQSRMLQGALSTMTYLADTQLRPGSPVFDDRVGVPSVSSAGLRANRDRIGGFSNR